MNIRRISILVLALFIGVLSFGAAKTTNAASLSLPGVRVDVGPDYDPFPPVRTYHYYRYETRPEVDVYRYYDPNPTVTVVPSWSEHRREVRWYRHWREDDD